MKAHGELQRSLADFLRNYLITRLELSQLSTRIKKPVIQNETINVSEKSWCMYYILLCLFSLLSSSLVLHLLKKKKEWYPLVILNADFSLLNHRQIILSKYLAQITQEVLFLPSWSSFLKKVPTNLACCPLHPNFCCLSHLSIIITSICL